MKAQNVALVPTLKLLASGGRREVLDQVRDYKRAGGQILFGTDVGYLPDYDPLHEYELMEAAGLTWRQILASLTTDPAIRFNERSQRARLASGMDGDVVVLGSDPVAVRARSPMFDTRSGWAESFISDERSNTVCSRRRLVGS
jgi:imidazolonepropionase-like amidohydrolase